MLYPSTSSYKTRVYTFCSCCCSCLFLSAFFLKRVYVYGIIHGDFAVFNFLLLHKCFVGSGVFIFYFFFIFHIVGTSFETSMSLWAMCLRAITKFLQVKVKGKSGFCYLATSLWWQTWLVPTFLGTLQGSPRLSHTQKLHIKVGENKDPMVIH